MNDTYEDVELCHVQHIPGLKSVYYDEPNITKADAVLALTKITTRDKFSKTAVHTETVILPYSWCDCSREFNSDEDVLNFLGLEFGKEKNWDSEIKAYKERKHRMELRRQQKQTLS